jgi:acetyl/propionyl-CoA carboxylase alpha subunit/acetyl-CoA carboxylase carboxyltransferase component
MDVRKVLVANRGEIAIRIMKAAAEMDIKSVAVYSADDAASLHVSRADEAVALTGIGAPAYLDSDGLIAAAKDMGCDAVHPGYGFLSENAGFARQCAEAGLTFIGPRPEILESLGDKGRARALAQRAGVPTLPGTEGHTSLDDATAFFDSLGPGAAVVVKAIAGGGGRGMRVVEQKDDLARAYARCQSEAQAAFGNPEVYVERLIPRARHIEVQVAGDGSGQVSHFWERDCTIQRRHQKVVEVAPSPALSPEVRARLMSAAVGMAEMLRYDNIGTFEFLLDERSDADNPSFVFIEANPRLQVEHTVTEEVTGIDLVQVQFELARGRTLAELKLTQADIPAPTGYAIQLRVNMERMREDGTTLPSAGTLERFDPPSGAGVRIETFGYAGYQTSQRFDSLLAKVVVSHRSTDFASVVSRAYRALCEFRIDGVSTNIPFLQNLLLNPDFLSGRIYTRFVEDHIGELIAPAGGAHPRLFPDSPPIASAAAATMLAGARVDSNDPLAVLKLGKSASPGSRPRSGASAGAGLPAGTVVAPMQGTVVSLAVKEGDEVHAGEPILVMEAMKMEHVIAATVSGVVQHLHVAAGDAVYEGATLASIDEREVTIGRDNMTEQLDLTAVRPDLEEVMDRHAITLDARRPDAVAIRRATEQRTPRENINDLVDEGTFVEYGQLVIAAQRQKRSLQDLIERTPADGLITGIGSINGELFGPERSKCVVMSYDYTVLAGTQGQQNHRKHDRMFELAEEMRLPLVFFTEGGGGRAGDSDNRGVSGLRGTMTFRLFGKLSGLVPLVGVNSGRCFAGNAALLGACDVVIATENSNIGMGGPALIEGGGLGVFRPEEVGPMDVQVQNGVVDIAVADEAEAVNVARKYLSYFQGRVPHWECADQRLLRSKIPENRLRAYDVRSVLETMADTDSVLELRREFGRGMVTALIRIEGRPLGVVANNASFLAGAIDSDGADKAARFMQLCDAFDLPLLFLCDTPGIMVGPEAEKTALVRHCNRLFVTSANLSVPFFTMVLRKGYGLGAMAMAGGTFKAPSFVVSWPTGEFGGMGLEGQVKLGYRNELAAIDDPTELRRRYEELVAVAYENGKALNFATHFEIDDVIDPADSRYQIVSALQAAPPPAPRTGKKRPFIDTW